MRNSKKILDCSCILIALIAAVLPFVFSYPIEGKILSFLIAVSMLLSLVKNKVIRYIFGAIGMAIIVFLWWRFFGV